MLQTIRIDYTARPQFIPFHQRTQRFACIVAHRRAGKTVACIHDLVDGALRCQLPRPRFAYIAPLMKQAKSVSWDYLQAATKPLVPLGATLNQNELRADFHNGGQVRLYGADNIDALRGIYLDGVVLDEPADLDPKLWSQVIRPTLSDRKGWAVFIGTPKGHNAFYEIWAGRDGKPGAKDNPEWFSLMLKASETEILPNDELAAARRDLTEEEYEQEYECSFEAAVIGAYYGRVLAEAERKKRITGVAHDSAVPVITSWDIGIDDCTAIWFAQVVGREVHIIDYYEGSGVGADYYVKYLQAQPYLYSGHILPHDAAGREKSTGETYQSAVEKLGLKNVTVLPLHRVEHGIEIARQFIGKCWFDKTKCARGIEALKLYRSEWDSHRRIPSRQPIHDWTSHAADSFRYLAKGMNEGVIASAGFTRKLAYPNYGYV